MNVVDAILSPSLAKKRRAPDMKGAGISLISGGLVVIFTNEQKIAQGMTFTALGFTLWWVGKRWE